MSDIANQQPRGGYAADNRPEAPRPYPAGKEPATTAKGDDRAHDYKDLAK